MVVCVGDGDVHVVCVWRYINEWWSRWLNNNNLYGAIPTELGQLTNLEYLYVLFTPPSFHVAHSRALSFLSPARCAPFRRFILLPPRVLRSVDRRRGDLSVERVILSSVVRGVQTAKPT